MGFYVLESEPIGENEVVQSDAHEAKFHATSMSSEYSLYELTSGTMLPCSMEKLSFKQAGESWLCLGCAFPKPDCKEIDITIQGARPDETPINFVSGCGVGIISREFILALGEEQVHRSLYLGRLFGEDGSLLERWATFIGKKRIVVRGSEHVSYRWCSECGRLVYFALGRSYLCQPPTDEFDIFDSGSGGLVVTQELMERVSMHKWPKLIRTRLPVLEVPLDGLPVLIPK